MTHTQRIKTWKPKKLERSTYQEGFFFFLLFDKSSDARDETLYAVAESFTKYLRTLPDPLLCTEESRHINLPSVFLASCAQGTFTINGHFELQ